MDTQTLNPLICLTYPNTFDPQSMVLLSRYNEVAEATVNRSLALTELYFTDPSEQRFTVEVEGELTVAFVSNWTVEHESLVDIGGYWVTYQWIASGVDVVARIDGKQSTIWIDGELQATLPVEIDVQAKPYRLGFCMSRGMVIKLN